MVTSLKTLVVATTGVAIIIAAVVASFFISGAGAGADSVLRPGAPGGGIATARPALPVVSQADGEFVAGMIPHHEQALRLVDELEMGVPDGVVQVLAERFRVAQTGELQVLRDWQAQHADIMPNHAHAVGMISDADMTELGTLTGTAAEIRFLELMIRHHRGAIDMATARLKSGGEGIITDYARNVYVEQSVEIARMQELLATLTTATG